MTQFKKVLIGCALPLVMMACAKNRDNNPVTNNAEMVKNTDTNMKTFEGACTATPARQALTVGMVGLAAAREKYQFKGSNFYHKTVYFTTADCTGKEALAFQEEGISFTSPDVKTADNAKPIDIDYHNLYVQVLSDDGALIANKYLGGLCGNADWAVTQNRDVTAASANANCYLIAVPRKSYNVYRVDNGTTLYIGSKNGADTPAKRPTSIDNSLKHESQSL